MRRSRAYSLRSALITSTRDARAAGVDPIASRTPNSRVRVLTENARTPATPTTAMSSATPANPLKTSALTWFGDRISERMSSSVAARSTGRSAASSRMIFVTGVTSLVEAGELSV